MSGLLEPMRDVIGRALYEEPVLLTDGSHRNWYHLSEQRREAWRADADRVIEAIKAFAPKFKEYAYENAAADWLGLGPDELWTDFLDSILEHEKPVADHIGGGDGLCKGVAASPATGEK